MVRWVRDAFRRIPVVAMNRLGVPADFLKSDITARADIEFTSGCNLRCVYCASRKSSYESQDLDLDRLQDITGCLKRRRVLTLGVSGHGETTTVKDWHQHCNRMLDQGFELYLSSNLARELSDEEAETLSRFRIVQASCDTMDLRLFKELRPGGDFRTLVYNMGKIRGQAIKDNRRPPVFWWHCVVSDRTVWKIEEFVSFGLAQGVKLFNFINLVKHEEIEAMKSVSHIVELPRDRLDRIGELFERVFRLIRRNGATYICDSLLEALKQKLHEDAAGEKHRDRQPVHMTEQKPGMTRNCLDPWAYAKVAADGAVIPCCRGFEGVGFLGRDGDLESILNGSEMRSFRESLLSGRLRPVCLTCNIRDWTEIDRLKLKVATYLRFGKFLPLLHKAGVLLPLIHRMRRGRL